jgi:phospholipid/cholesterol/gamma-HCH transport system substrate-binding protein
MRTPIAGFRVHVLTTIAGLAVALGLLLTLLYLGHGLPSTTSVYEVDAVLPTSAALAPGARVTAAGADVGTVGSVTRRGAGAVIRLRITDDRVTPLPQDTQVMLRARTPIGENYVSIVPGRSKATLSSGGTLPMDTGNDYVDVDQILTVLQGQSRKDARRLIQGLGGGLQGRGDDLHAVLGESAKALTDGSEVAAVLDRDRSDVAQLVQRLGDVMQAVGDRGAAIRDITATAATTFRAIGQRDAAVRRLLAELPPTLVQVRATTRRVDQVTGQAAPVLANLAAALVDVRPAVRRLSPAVAIGRGVVNELGAAALGLRTTLQKVRAVSGPAAGALPSVRSMLCQADPVIRYAKPYTADIISALGGLGSAANAYDALGHTIRLTAILSDNSLVGLPPDVVAAEQTLLHSGFLSKMNPLSWDPYPKPGQIGKNTAAGQSVLGPDQVPATGYKFPRILADC